MSGRNPPAAQEVDPGGAAEAAGVTTGMQVKTVPGITKTAQITSRMWLNTLLHKTARITPGSGGVPGQLGQLLSTVHVAIVDYHQLQWPQSSRLTVPSVPCAQLVEFQGSSVLGESFEEAMQV